MEKFYVEHCENPMNHPLVHESSQSIIQEIDLTTWKGSFSAHHRTVVLNALEKGEVLYAPQLSFELLPEEKQFLTPRTLDTHSKNISFNVNNARLKGSRLKNEQWVCMKNMLSRYQQYTQHLLCDLIPQYQPHLISGRTSYRPIEIIGRKTSILKDDTQLHVDAFSATPTQGHRILRVFTNINPHGQSRHWLLGEPFAQVVKHFAHTLKKPILGTRQVLSVLGLTKSYRSLYDHYMLQLHNHMKQDSSYQTTVQKQAFHFPPGSSWIVMTDAVSHAALSGQFLLEQSFYLPVKAMQNPQLSPLCVLQQMGFSVK